MGYCRLSKAAEINLGDIFEYGALRFGIGQAENYLLEMEQNFHLLSKNVNLGRDASEFAIGLNKFTYKSHVVFYQLADDGIFIVRVLHQSRDFERHL